MIPPQLLPFLAGAGLAVLVLYLNLWRAVLFLWPTSIRIETEAPADQMALPDEAKTLAKELQALGFAALGSHSEKPRLRRATLSYDFVHAAEEAFATVYLSRTGQARLYFFTPAQEGGFVITANYRRPARQIDARYLSGGLEEATVERLFRAHKKRCVGFRPTSGWTLDDRVARGQAWFDGPGRSEIRQQNLHGLLWSAGTVALVLVAIFGRRG